LGDAGGVTAPVEYLLVGFPGNQFNGEILPALAQLVEDGLVRIIDLAFIKKDADGSVTIFEYDELEEVAGVADIDGEADGLLSDADLVEAAEGLEPNTSAALLVWEDLWAERFADALYDSGGEVLAGERIPRAIVEAALAALGDS
jgi:hypothetical protein